MSDCKQCKSFYLELERLRRLTPTGTYTLNVAHEEEIQRLRSQLENVLDNHAEGCWQARALDAERERDEALRLAYIGEHYFEDLSWKAQHGLLFEDLAKMREALRAAEKRELEALAELDEAKATIRIVLEADCLKLHAFERGDDDASVYELCKSVVRKT